MSMQIVCGFYAQLVRFCASRRRFPSWRASDSFGDKCLLIKTLTITTRLRSNKRQWSPNQRRRAQSVDHDDGNAVRIEGLGEIEPGVFFALFYVYDAADPHHQIVDAAKRQSEGGREITT